MGYYKAHVLLMFKFLFLNQLVFQELWLFSEPLQISVQPFPIENEIDDF